MKIILTAIATFLSFAVASSIIQEVSIWQLQERIATLEAAPTRTHTCELVDGKNRYTCRYIEIEEVR